MLSLEIENQEVSGTGTANGYEEYSSSGVSVMTAAELGAKIEGPQVQAPGHVQAGVENILKQMKAKMAGHVGKNVQKALMANGQGPQVMAGEVVDDAGYEYWDILAISPQQFIAPPFTFRPHKVVAGGEFVLLTAVLFINPLATTGGGPSATTHLGGRDFRIRFEQVDLTNVANGADFTLVGQFSPIAPVISIFSVLTLAPNPGPNPQLVELNVTADITNPGQPYAAFATQWFDIENDPGWPVPRQGGLRNPVPLRYLVYPK
jgi:hypothetical protein